MAFKTKQLDDFKVSTQLALVGDEAKPPRIIRAAIAPFLANWAEYCKAVRLDNMPINHKNESNEANHNNNSTTMNCSKAVSAPPVVSPNEKGPQKKLQHNIDKNQNGNNKQATTTAAKADEKEKMKFNAGCTTSSDVLNAIGRALLNKIIHPDALVNIGNLFNTSLTVDQVLNCLAEATMDIEVDEKIIQAHKDAALLAATEPQTLPVDKSLCPFLCDKNIDVTNLHEVQCVLRDVAALHWALCKKKDVENILRFPSYNNQPISFVRVPSCINRAQFQKTLSRYGHWVNGVLDAMIPFEPKKTKELDEIDEEGGPQVRWSNREDAAEALMAHLGCHYGAAFMSASDIIGMPVVRRSKMDAPTAAAMWNEAGVYCHGQRIIHKYYLNHFGVKFTVSEREIRKLALEAINPITGSTMVGEEEIFWWYKDPATVITRQIKKIVGDNQPVVRFDKIDIILGGDHGQKAFRLSVRVLLKMGEKIVRQFTANIGEVECKKESSEMLWKTILTEINERLKGIMTYTRDGDSRITSDGMLWTIREPCGEEHYSFQKPNDVLASVLEEKSAALRFFITGDLAFYATVLGMEGASATACWLCLQKKNAWTEFPTELGQPRTMEWILQNAPAGDDNQASKKKTRGNGMKEQPILDAIDTCRYIVPPLHAMLGVTNALLTELKHFIDTLLEDTPVELQQLREDEMKAEKQWWVTKIEVGEWTVEFGPDIASCIQAEKDIKDILEYEDDYRTATQAEMKDMEDELAKLAKEIIAFKAAKKKVKDAVKAQNAIWLACQRKVKGYGARSKEIRFYKKPLKSRLEKVLRRYGIDYAAYHGGELVGNDCRKLLHSAEDIMAEIEEVLLEVAEEKDMLPETKISISSRCKCLCFALVCFDGVFSLMFTKNENVNVPVDSPKLAVLLEKALAAWQNLKKTNANGFKNIPPKVHALVQHLLGQFNEYHGIGDYDEQFVERSHQSGKKYMYRSRAIRCRDKNLVALQGGRRSGAIQ
jgi:hypothetical protein